MTLFKTAAVMCCLALASVALAPCARAGEWDRKTVMTFSGPVETPGVHLKGWGVLPAGTYVFRILDSSSSRHIVQILSQDEKTMYATIVAIPNYRFRATDQTVVTFRERPAGQPEALRAWFYPGRTIGEEFVYPKAKAIVLARETNTPVLFLEADIPVEVAEPVKSADEPLVLALKQAPVAAIMPTGAEVQLAEVVTPPPPEVLVASAPPPAMPTLPATASTLPLVGLLALLALGGAFAVRAFARRVQ